MIGGFWSVTEKISSLLVLKKRIETNHTQLPNIEEEDRNKSYAHTNRFCVVQENIKPEVLKYRPFSVSFIT